MSARLLEQLEQLADDWQDFARRLRASGFDCNAEERMLCVADLRKLVRDARRPQPGREERA